MPKDLELTITGRIPSKKNSRCIFVRRGRLLNIPSAKYTAWHREASKQIKQRFQLQLTNVAEVSIDFYAPDKRATDLTNKAESLMDLLVDCGVLKDDNWWIVNRVVLNFKGVDKPNPRAVVHIHAYDT
jgi:Holliday junction resolvase RusA-like endonuclease